MRGRIYLGDMRDLARWLLLNGIPVLLMGGVVSLAVFGDHGLIRRHHLLAQQGEVETRIAELSAENAALRRQLRVLDSSRRGVTRLAAEELLMAPEGSIIYRFDDTP